MTQVTPEQSPQPEAPPSTEPFVQSPGAFLLAGLLLAAAVDVLFWQKSPGISIILWIVLALVGLFLLARHEKVRPNPLSLLLAGGILLMAGMTALRLEGFTRFINTALALGGLVLLAATFTNGNWFYYRVVDYIVPVLVTVFGGLVRPGRMLNQSPGMEQEQGRHSPLPRVLRQVLPVLRGLLIAAPIVGVLGVLLSAADMAFAKQLEDFFALFQLERLPEYLFRLFYILFLGYTFTGVFLQAVLPQEKVEHPDPQRSWVKPFLGWTEAAIVLGSINLLFLFFVVVQFRYLFGGTTNITALNFTYADYARRGFGELLAVALLSLLTYLSLSAVTRKETVSQRRGFSILSVLLVALVLVILASSLQRMLLYEAAYGFTRLRTYTHVFIFCLAALLIATIVLELTGNRGRFGLALLLFSFTFVLSLGVMNVDAFIARQNIERVAGPQGDWKTLDGYYLSELSNDAVPVIVAAYQNPALSEKTRHQLGAELVCRLTLAARQAEENPVSWQSYHPSHVRAIRLMNNLSEQLFGKYSVQEDEYGGLYVPLGFDRHDCYYQYWMD